MSLQLTSGSGGRTFHEAALRLNQEVENLTLLSYSYSITGISKPADKVECTKQMHLKLSANLIIRGGGKVAKAVKLSGTPRTRTPLTPEARENQMISLAMDLAEQQLRDGTASSQLITEFVKRGSTKARVEKELLEKQRDLAAAKAESIKAADRLEELLPKVMKAMGRYRGDDEEEGDPDDDY